ncbi:heme o synthase [Brachybacterium saurashtrense]|uniref:Protoheme IX farnesyltransferase n=1 Tax=Brachybacterium saurashtrense TaxID=556288 RepID=A0A345YMA8_9MICO|nr:heme o synthase [Brachybacterium saurashtrense]AXK45060.1 protoheme IX farnesyltransferase [Brachybacterium saurashtrense]RRR21744.1 protoheme IX farnesyltransferase [Brachybacterium saurashtrense]
MTATQGPTVRNSGRDGERAPRSVGAVLRGYVALTKPRIIELLLITTIPTMFLAAGGFPSPWLILTTMIGGYLAAGGANALNMYLDRDIDAKMKRTRNRPLVTGEISPRAGLVFGIALSLVSAVWLGLLVNWMSAALAVGAILLYVVFYTMILKRRTSQNIVWGGVAGCMPVLIGWSSVTGTVSWTAVLLFAVIFFWTPPHYWPLAEKFSRDYAEAGVPMLPVVASRRSVSRQMILHTALMIAASLAIIPLGATGWVYGVGAVASGAWFGFLVVRYAMRVHRGLSGKALGPMVVFHGSITYLTVLFVALAIDPFVTL